MKDRLFTSCVIALAVNMVGMFINYRSFQLTKYLKWAFRVHGGEITAEYGFGWHAVHTYGMSPETMDTHALGFDWISLVICLVIAFVAAFLALYFVDWLWNKIHPTT